MLRLLAAAALVAPALTAPSFAVHQLPQQANLRFEVASVKPNPERVGIRGYSFPGDRFVATNSILKDLIALAYAEPGQTLPWSRLVGGPGWITSNRFDINAKIGPGSANTVAQKQRMLRALLAERFRLITHTESRDLPIYALARVRNDSLGPRLSRTDIDCDPIVAAEPGRRDRCILYALPSGDLMLRGQPMKALAMAFSLLLDRPVVDRTGLTGGFDADAEFNPEGLPGMSQNPDRPARDVPSLFTALEEQLGLRLESTRGSVEIIVIDSVEQPTPD
jgi:uncharacterized protein (TIGR03435 family)